MITLELPYPSVSGNHHTRHARGRHYLTDEALRYRRLVAAVVMAGGHHLEPLRGPLEVQMWVAPPDRRARDEDNLKKPLMDALTKAGLWLDDSNKVIRASRLEWIDPEPGGRILLTVRRL